MQGDLGGAKALLPRIVRDPIKAINLASQGVTDSRGNTILPPAKLSPYDIGLQAVGFQPSKVSEVREKPQRHPGGPHRAGTPSGPSSSSAT